MEDRLISVKDEAEPVDIKTIKRFNQQTIFSRVSGVALWQRWLVSTTKLLDGWT